MRSRWCSSGVGWVEALRSSQRAVWLLDQHPGNWLIRRLVDLGMLIGLGLLLGLSLALTAAIDKVLDWLAPDTTFGNTLLRSSGPVLELAVNFVLAAAVLAGGAPTPAQPAPALPVGDARRGRHPAAQLGRAGGSSLAPTTVPRTSWSPAPSACSSISTCSTS